MTNKEAIEKIVEYEFCYKLCGHPPCYRDKEYCTPLLAFNNGEYKEHRKEDFVIRVVGFLSLLESLGYVQKVKDQRLPNNRYTKADKLLWIGYEEGQQDMLTPDKNGCVWVKVEKELK